MLNHQLAIAFREVIEAAAADLGCEVVAVWSAGRGVPQVARARVVAMKVCVVLGIPYWRVAKAFRRSKRSVHEALRIGRPGRAARDADLEERWRRVLAAVKAAGVRDFKRRGGAA